MPRRFSKAFNSDTKSSKSRPNSGKSLKTPKSTSPPSARLPHELYRLVLAFLSRNTKLYPLLFVNSAFSAEVVRVLYSNISLKEDLSKRNAHHEFRTMIECHIRLFELLARTARLSHLVHSITVPLYAGICQYETQELYEQTLNRALCAMPNLKEFVYRNAREIKYDTAQISNDLFKGCTFRLRKATILSPALTNRDLKMLGSDAIGEELEELSMLGRYDGQFDPHSAFPRLAVLEILGPTPGVGSMPKLLPPPRTIKALCFYSPILSRTGPYPDVFSLRIVNGPSSSLDWGRFVVVFPSLRFLNINIAPFMAEVVRRFSHPILPCLMLTRTSQSNDHLALLTAMITNHLSALVHLRKVAFDNWTSFVAPMPRQRQRFAYNLLSRIVHLETVCTGSEEWNRIELDRGRPRIYGRHDEWKDRKWWDSS